MHAVAPPSRTLHGGGHDQCELKMPVTDIQQRAMRSTIFCVGGAGQAQAAVFAEMVAPNRPVPSSARRCLPGRCRFFQRVNVGCHVALHKRLIVSRICSSGSSCWMAAHTLLFAMRDSMRSCGSPTTGAHSMSFSAFFRRRADLSGTLRPGFRGFVLASGFATGGHHLVQQDNVEESLGTITGRCCISMPPMQPRRRGSGR